MRQLAYFDRAADPVAMDVGPVLGLKDVIGGKACALAGRAAGRRLDKWGDGVFATFGLSPGEIAVLRERFAS